MKGDGSSHNVQLNCEMFRLPAVYMSSSTDNFIKITEITEDY